MTGRFRCRVTGYAGATLRMRSGEQLAPDGSVICDNFLVAGEAQLDTLRLETDVSDYIWEPKFGYRGFRWTQLDVEGEASAEMVQAVPLYTELDRVGSFSADRADPGVDRHRDRTDFPKQPPRCPDRHTDLRKERLDGGRPPRDGGPAPPFRSAICVRQVARRPHRCPERGWIDPADHPDAWLGTGVRPRLVGVGSVGALVPLPGIRRPRNPRADGVDDPALRRRTHRSARRWHLAEAHLGRLAGSRVPPRARGHGSDRHDHVAYRRCNT